MAVLSPKGMGDRGHSGKRDSKGQSSGGSSVKLEVNMEKKKKKKITFDPVFSIAWRWGCPDYIHRS